MNIYVVVFVLTVLVIIGSFSMIVFFFISTKRDVNNFLKKIQSLQSENSIKLDTDIEEEIKRAMSEFANN
jgi:hypothetical protein